MRVLGLRWEYNIGMVEPVYITDLDDARVAVFRGLKDRELARGGERFVAEGLHLVQRLLRSSLRCESVMVAPRKLDAVMSMVSGSTAVYIVSEALSSSIVGFRFHTGAIAIGVRPAAGVVSLDSVVGAMGGRGFIVVCPDVASAENLGSMVRTSAALGASAMLIGPACVDPWYRLGVRVSMGAVLELPIVRSVDLLGDLGRLRSAMGFELCATVLADDAVALQHYEPRRGRVAVLFGSEAEGLSPQVVDACDAKVTVPMGWGTDSLNVAVSAGVVLWEVGRRVSRV